LHFKNTKLLNKTKTGTHLKKNKYKEKINGFIQYLILNKKTQTNVNYIKKENIKIKCGYLLSGKTK